MPEWRIKTVVKYFQTAGQRVVKGLPAKRKTGLGEISLRHPFEFDQVFKGSEKRSSNQQFLILAKRNQLGYCRIGCVISRKSVAKANRRNHIKRHAREWIRSVNSKPNTLMESDFVLLAQRSTKLLDRLATRQQLFQLFSKMEKILAVQ